MESIAILVHKAVVASMAVLINCLHTNGMCWVEQNTTATGVKLQYVNGNMCSNNKTHRYYSCFKYFA